jgi:hypothetical protein
MDDAFKIAVVSTVFYKYSHADVISSRWIAARPGDDEWGWPAPKTKVVSYYLDQIHDNDIGQEICRENGVPLYGTVAGALGQGGDGLTVDGVLVIGEHGDYPRNDFDQILYPRKELFDRVVEVFRSTGQSVPVFCDKHLSWNSDWAKEMHETARSMGFLLISGSSVPLCPRLPRLEMPDDPRIKDAVVVFCGHDEAYGFHSLEFAQAILEARKGAESGIGAITVWRGPDAWRQFEQGAWSSDLMDAAIEAVRISSEGKKRNVRPGHYRDNCKPDNADFTAFRLEYLDGLRVTHINLGAHLTSWGIAMQVEGSPTPHTAGPVMGEEVDHFGHFATLDRMIEEAFLSNRPDFSPERNLLTTCTTAVMMRGRANPGVRIETPELAISYNPKGFRGMFPLS